MKNVTLKVSVVVAVTALVFVSIHYRDAANAERRAQMLEEKLAEKERKVSELSYDRDRLSSRLEAYLNEAQRGKEGRDTETLESQDELDAKVEILKEVFDRLPEQAIPELRLATLSDWYVAVDGNLLHSIDDYRRAMGRMRSLTQARFAKFLQPALADYLRTNNGEFPSDTMQLRGFVGTEIDDEMLRRYRVVPAKSPEEVMATGGASVGGKWQITQVSLIDSEYDSHSVIGADGFGSYSMR